MHVVMGTFIICNPSSRCFVAVQFGMPHASPSLQKTVHELYAIFEAEESSLAKKGIRMMMTTRMIKETTEMKATAAKKAMRMMMTKRMAMTAMTPPTM